jgi:uncharacterized protein YpmS
MAELNYDPRLPTEPTSWAWKVIRFVIIAFWVVLAVLAARVIVGTVADDVEREDSSAFVAVD